MRITVEYESLDGYRLQRTFKTLAGAQRFAHRWISQPEIGRFYAVSFDGIGKITVWGDATLETLYPEQFETPAPAPNFASANVAATYPGSERHTERYDPALDWEGPGRD